MLSKPIYKELLRAQYFFCFVVFFVILLFTGFYEPNYNLEKLGNPEMGHMIVIYDIAFASLAAVFIAIIWASIQTSWLRRKKVTEFYASLPYKKKIIIYSNYFVGITILLSGYLTHSCIAILNSVNSAVNFTGLFTIYLLFGGLAMVCAYTVFFLLGIAYNSGFGVLLTTVIIIGLLISDRVLASGFPQSIGARLFDWLLQGIIYVMRIYMTGYDNMDYHILYLYGMLFFVIIIGFLLIGIVADRRDAANKKGHFSIPIPSILWGIIGVVIGYTTTGIILIILVLLQYLTDAPSAYEYIPSEWDTVADFIAYYGIIINVLAGAIIFIWLAKKRGWVR